MSGRQKLEKTIKQNNTFQILCEILRNTQPELLTAMFLHPEAKEDLMGEVWALLIRVIRGRWLTVFVVLEDIEYIPLRERVSLLEYFDQIGTAIYLGTTGTRCASLNLLMITKDQNIADQVTSRVTVDHEHLRLTAYSPKQRKNILRTYAEVRLQQEAYDVKVISKVEELSRGFANMRYAIDLLWRAAKLAGDEGGTQITEEYVVQAFQEERNNILSPILKFRQHQQLYLYSLAKLLQDSTTTSVTTSRLESKYIHYCEEYDLKPRRGTTLYDYLQAFEALQLIDRYITKPDPAASLALKGVTVNEIIQLLSPVIDRLKEKVS